MKKRRFSLSLAVLLPIMFVILAGIGGTYAGGYFLLRNAEAEAAKNEDSTDLNRAQFMLMGDTAEGGGGGVATRNALLPVINKYYEYNPQTLPDPKTPEGAQYVLSLTEALTSSALGNNFNNLIERYVTTCITMMLEDTTNNRMVVVYSSDLYRPNAETSIYMGYFFTKDAKFESGAAYGFTTEDSSQGNLFTSGLYFGEISSPVTSQKQYGPYRIWMFRYTAFGEVYGASPIFARNFAILAAGVVLLVGPLLYFLLLLLVIRPMRKLSHSGNDYVATLNEGDPAEIFAPFPGKVTNEISDLNDTLYVTQEAIRAYGHRIRESAAYEERINADLALAERIQSAMVPSVPIYAPLFRVRGQMKPAKEVGGDLYNYVMLDDDHVAFFIGDVSGKGVPAALFMAKANTVLQMVLKDFDIDEANRILSKDNTELFFVTAFAAVVEISTGKMRYVNAGHEPVFLYHDGEYAALPEEPNFMFGCIEDFHYAVQETVLSKGDVLFLYTDGISEAMNEAGDLFGKERILEALNSSVGLPCGESFKIVSRAVSDFVGNAEQSDDACMVGFDYGRKDVLEFSCDADGLAKISAFADKFLADADPAIAARIQVCLDELCSNVVFYSGSTTAPRLVLCDTGDRYVGYVIDEGKPFNPLTDKPVADPDKPGGHGITIARDFLDTLEYHHVQDSNILVFSAKHD